VDKGRLESFSDGVFAVAATVLVFNLLSIGTGRGLSYGDVLGGLAWQRYAAYATGFLTIGIMWLNHHTLVAHARRVDRVTLILNIFLLMGIVAVPYPTALVADHLSEPGSAGRVAVVSYGVVSILLSVGFAAMWGYVSARASPLAAAPAAERLKSFLRFTAGLIAYVAGTLVAGFASPVAGLVIFAAVAVYYLFEHLPAPGADPDQGRPVPGETAE
jgi:TMEM175 potassium channel family protein